jgi:hypothetical protein
MVEPSQAITLESLHDAVSNVLASDLQAYEDGGEYDGFAIGGRYARGAEPNIAIEQAFLNAAGAAGIPVGAPCAHGQYGELIALLHDLELDRLQIFRCLVVARDTDPLRNPDSFEHYTGDASQLIPVPTNYWVSGENEGRQKASPFMTQTELDNLKAEFPDRLVVVVDAHH